jgi:hypothetical protein
MPERFTSGVYVPEVATLMGAALDQAWADFEPKPGNVTLARELMATAKIEKVEAGVDDFKALERAATVGLISGIKAGL